MQSLAVHAGILWDTANITTILTLCHSNGSIWSSRTWLSSFAVLKSRFTMHIPVLNFSLFTKHIDGPLFLRLWHSSQRLIYSLGRTHTTCKPVCKGKFPWIFGARDRPLSRRVKTLLAFLPAPEGCAREKIFSRCTFACRKFHAGTERVHVVVKEVRVGSGAGRRVDPEHWKRSFVSVTARGDQRIVVRCCCRACSPVCVKGWQRNTRDRSRNPGTWATHPCKVWGLEKSLEISSAWQTQGQADLSKYCVATLGLHWAKTLHENCRS